MPRFPWLSVPLSSRRSTSNGGAKHGSSDSSARLRRGVIHRSASKLQPTSSRSGILILIGNGGLLKRTLLTGCMRCTQDGISCHVTLVLTFFCETHDACDHSSCARSRSNYSTGCHRKRQRCRELPRGVCP